MHDVLRLAGVTDSIGRRLCTHTGEGAGMMALPGGHAEPAKLGIHSVEDFEAGRTPAVPDTDLMHELYDRCVSLRAKS